MPKSRVRLSAGRSFLTREAQILCLVAGANSIFYGEKLLTTANNDAALDRELIARLGLNILETTEGHVHAHDSHAGSKSQTDCVKAAS
jgi:biotin synthase